ncbi:MAG: response regulator [Bacteroidales bacterium]|nr:response regulator [Bacteroidales bacterium]
MENIKENISTLLKGYNILIAEDFDTNYYLLESILTANAANVIWAKNGEEAVNSVKTNKIDLILMDLKMPVLDGDEATQIIKKINPSIPIIMQTAFAYSIEDIDTFTDCYDGFLIKPIKPVQLLQLVSELLENTKNI